LDERAAGRGGAVAGAMSPGVVQQARGRKISPRYFNDHRMSLIKFATTIGYLNKLSYFATIVQ